MTKKTIDLELPDAQGKGITVPLLRVNKVMVKQEEIRFDLDIYFAGASEVCFHYYSSAMVQLVLKEDEWQVKNRQIRSNSEITYFYGTRDKLDRNGSLCLEENAHPGNLFTAQLIYPARIMFTLDENQNGRWLLKKTEARKQQITYATVQAEKSQYKLKIVEQLSTARNPEFHLLTENRFIISNQMEPDKFEMKLYIW
jgi:hypothetical protein